MSDGQDVTKEFCGAKGQSVTMPRRVTPEYKAAVGERLRRTREALGLSIAELARQLGERANTWTQYETGDRLPDPIILEKWARRAPIDLGWIYWGRMDKLPYDLATKLTTTAESAPSKGGSSARRARQKAAK